MKFPDERFKEEGRTRVNVKQLWDTQNKILHLLNLGNNGVTVAKQLGITEETVSVVRNSVLGRNKLDLLRAIGDSKNIDDRQRMLETTPKAMSLLEEIIEASGSGEEASLALRAKYADKHLARVGLGPITKAVNMSGQLTREDIEEMKTKSNQAYESGSEPDS